MPDRRCLTVFFVFRYHLPLIMLAPSGMYLVQVSLLLNLNVGF